MSELKTFSIENRRYLGNKQRLLSEIETTVHTHCPNAETVLDLFAGTGVVGACFSPYQTVYTNDLLYSNYLCHYAWLKPEPFDESKLKQLLTHYNFTQPSEENYMSEMFGDTFFSRKVCKKIGWIREDIESRFMAKELNEKERAILIMSLLYAMDRIANTCGHYDAYRKQATFRGDFELRWPLIPNSKYFSFQHDCFNEDANELVKRVQADFVYIDPPYNSRQYSDAYHLLENVARWEKPEVFGVARKMNRNHLKSDYCSMKAPIAFAELIKNLQTKLIIVSYNNTEQKANARSNAKLSDQEILNALEERGKVTIHEVDFKAFNTGKTPTQQLKERLFICEVTPHES